MALTIAKRVLWRICRTHRAVTRVPRKLQRAWQWLRFGDITETTKAVDGGVVSEVEYRGRNDKVIGYWAYGYFDPAYPYQG
jgi:hypothetical protein